MQEGGKRLVHNDDNRPKVTIITVVFNATKLLPGYFENIAPYLSPEVELVILDGGSTDGTIDLLHQNDSLIDYWRSEPDAGIYDAMNKAVKYAKGRWLYFLGADDRLLGGFAKSIGLLTEAAVVYYGKVIVWGEVLGKPYTSYDFTKAEICHQSIFYPASVFTCYQYDTRYKVAADHHLNMQCFTDKRYKWVFIDQLLAIYDTRGFSAEVTDTAFRKDYDAVLKKTLGWVVYLRYRFRKYKDHRKAQK